MSERFLDKIFQAFEDVAVQQEQSAPIVPSDGDDMTWSEDTLSKDTAMASESALAKVWGDDYTYKPPLIPAQWVPVTEYRQLVRMVYRLQNEMAGLAAQVVELRERMDKNEADS